MKRTTLVNAGTFFERVTLVLMGASAFGPRWTVGAMIASAVTTVTFGFFAGRATRRDLVKARELAADHSVH